MQYYILPVLPAMRHVSCCPWAGGGKRDWYEYASKCFHYYLLHLTAGFLHSWVNISQSVTYVAPRFCSTPLVIGARNR
jgi:hypothetical protein